MASTSCGGARSCAPAAQAPTTSATGRSARPPTLRSARQLRAITTSRSPRRSSARGLWTSTPRGQIAAHYEAAGATEEAIAWHTKAADAAQRLYASGDAVRSLERALALVLELAESRERDELELRLLTQLPAPLLAIEGYLSGRVAEVHERGTRARRCARRRAAGAVDPLAGAREPGPRRVRGRA